MFDLHFRAVLDSAIDGVLVESGDRIAYVNSAYARLLDYPRADELMAATVVDIAHPDDVDRLNWYGHCRCEGKPAPARYTFRARGRRGGFVTFDASVSHARIGGETLIATIVRPLEPEPADVTIPGMERLSTREMEIVRYLLDGRRSKEIALLLDVSEKTIYTHRSRAFRKMGLRGDRDLFRIASFA